MSSSPVTQKISRSQVIQVYAYLYLPTHLTTIPYHLYRPPSSQLSTPACVHTVWISRPTEGLASRPLAVWLRVIEDGDLHPNTKNSRGVATPASLASTQAPSLAATNQLLQASQLPTFQKPSSPKLQQLPKKKKKKTSHGAPEVRQLQRQSPSRRRANGLLPR